MRPLPDGDIHVRSLSRAHGVALRAWPASPPEPMPSSRLPCRCSARRRFSRQALNQTSICDLRRRWRLLRSLSSCSPASLETPRRQPRELLPSPSPHSGRAWQAARSDRAIAECRVRSFLRIVWAAHSGHLLARARCDKGAGAPVHRQQIRHQLARHRQIQLLGILHRGRHRPASSPTPTSGSSCIGIKRPFQALLLLDNSAA